MKQFIYKTVIIIIAIIVLFEFTIGKTINFKFNQKAEMVIFLKKEEKELLISLKKK